MLHALYNKTVAAIDKCNSLVSENNECGWTQDHL
jgi:hypothetical protein